MLLKQFLNKNISLSAKLNFHTSAMSTSNSFNNFQFFNFATKMRQGVTKNKKDSAGRRLGLKKFGGEEVRESQIIVRQRGFRYKAGENVHFGKDQTLHSSKEGIVKYTKDPTVNYRRVFVNVVEQEIPNRKLYPPKPFMYHPELYPELATKNIKDFVPLRINRDDKLKLLKLQKAAQKVRTIADEITIIQGENSSTKRHTNSLATAILEKSQKYSKIDKSNYTARYQIQPILEEIADIGVKYLIPNFEKNKTDSAKMLAKVYGNIIERDLPIPDITATEDEMYDLHINSQEDVSLNKATYNYVKEINKNTDNDMSLRDLIVEMKKENRFNPVFDIRSMPYDSEKMKKENNKFESLAKEKSELTNLLKKAESFSEHDEELKYILRDFQVESQEELIENISNSLHEIEKELYFTKNQISSKKEGKKFLERKKQMMLLVKSLRESHETMKRGVRKQGSNKSGIRKKPVQKKLKLNI